ncbi:hypothetical protein [Brazilian marseillevirus]|nr:hypothetical protein A3303_gp163 [Brazilian marseillevirus]AMQ10671.1 hypothetical protein [Brazilian marseillevirus]
MERYLEQNGCTIIRSFLSQENGGSADVLAECHCKPEGVFGRRE